MAIVIFDVEKFRAEFQGFSDETEYTDEFLTSCFELAESIVPNTESSYIPYDPDNNELTRERLLYLATCHIATLLGGDGDNPVGRVSSASQGTVSTSFDLVKYNSGIADWWNQTQCGAMFWVLFAKYRRGGRFYGFKTYHPYG